MIKLELTPNYYSNKPIQFRLEYNLILSLLILFIPYEIWIIIAYLALVVPISYFFFRPILERYIDRNVNGNAFCWYFRCGRKNQNKLDHYLLWRILGYKNFIMFRLLIFRSCFTASLSDKSTISIISGVYLI